MLMYLLFAYLTISIIFNANQNQKRMKHLRLLFIAITLIGLSGLTGCTTSSSSSPSTTYSLRATVGSTTVNASSCTASVVAGVLAIQGSTVTGGVGGKPQIFLTIYGWSGSAGTTAITAPTGTGAFAEYNPSSGTTQLSTTGSVTIST